MTSKERVLSSLHHEQPDRTPYCIGFTQKMHAKMAAYYGNENFEAGLGNDLVGLGTSGPNAWAEIEPAIWRDEFGVEWDRTVDKDIGVVRNQVVTRENLDAVPFPDPAAPERFAAWDGILRAHADRFLLADLGFSLFERAWTLFGMENLLMAMVTDPGWAHAFLDKILAHNLARIEAACAYPIDGMIIGDDWGSQQGLIMGPELWRDFIKPRVRQMYQCLRGHGKYVFIHSCGKVDELFPDLIECGVHCFNPFQPEVIDPFDAKEQYGGQLSFYGGISTQKLLPYGTSAQVREQVMRLIAEVGKDGGYIAAPSHATPPDAKPENVAAMIDVLQGKD